MTDKKPCACGRAGCELRRAPGQTDASWQAHAVFSPACLRMARVRRKRGPPMTAVELRMVQAMLRDGETYRQIGEALDRDHSGVRYAALRHGWRAVRGPHGRHPTLMGMQE